MKQYEIGFSKTKWQYITVEADNEHEAIKKAEKLLTKDWQDYNNSHEVCDVNIIK